MDRAALRKRLDRLFIAEEVASCLRHKLVNKLAGLGALAFHLKRHLPAGELSTAAAAVLPLMDAEVGEATAALELHFLGPPASSPDPLPLVAALTETLRSWRPADLGRVELVGPAPEPLAALIDPGELDLALCCLLENAWEAIAERGGVVRLRCRELPGENGLVAVEVTDDGPAPPERARDPFFTTKPGRLGLGLNVAGRAAMRARGRLELDGADGATARLILPRARP
jgi:signal transduction histidine kinase